MAHITPQPSPHMGASPVWAGLGWGAVSLADWEGWRLAHDLGPCSQAPPVLGRFLEQGRGTTSGGRSAPHAWPAGSRPAGRPCGASWGAELGTGGQGDLGRVQDSGRWGSDAQGLARPGLTHPPPPQEPCWASAPLCSH